MGSGEKNEASYFNVSTPFICIKNPDVTECPIYILPNIVHCTKQTKFLLPPTLFISVILLRKCSNILQCCAAPEMAEILNLSCIVPNTETLFSCRLVFLRIPSQKFEINLYLVNYSLLTKISFKRWFSDYINENDLL